jgi:hypothetical protein
MGTIGNHLTCPQRHRVPNVIVNKMGLRNGEVLQWTLLPRRK